MNEAAPRARIRRILDLTSGHPYYPLVVALIAFAATATFAFPFAIVLIPAVLVAPRRWLLLGVLSGIGSGAGGAVLVQVFHLLGRDAVLAHFPGFIASESWRLAAAWLQSYGLAALAVIAGSPLPQTPAIFFYSLAEPSLPGVFIAVALGKTVKYVFLAWLTARFPARFIGYR